jgi:hypothetical protein
MSDVLARAGASWDTDPSAGAWIAPLLGEFGPTIAANVPAGYAAHAVVSIPDPDAESDGLPYRFPWLDTLLDVLEPFTGDQPVHCGLWEGWAEFYDHGADPRTAPGMTVLVAWSEDERPSEAEEAEARRQAQESLVALRVERPAAAPLELPHRGYHLWTGPLRSAPAFRGQIDEPPSLLWPEDRSWFVAAPIYTREAAVGGTAAVVDALLASERLDARRADRATELDIDD